MIKKFFIFVFLFSLPVYAQAKEYSWGDLNTACFENSAEVEGVVSNKTIKVQTNPSQILFFIQDNKPLEDRIFTYGSEEYVRYEVSELSGEDKSFNNDIKFLTDKNFTTGFNFDPYSKDKREILVKLNKEMVQGTFSFRFNYRGNYKPRFFISKDGVDFIEVRNIEQYSFQYLKVLFDKYYPKDTKNYNLIVNELDFLLKGENTYLVNSVSDSKILLYASYECDNELFQKVISSLGKQKRKAVFSIDASTKEYEVSLGVNKSYDDDFDNDTILNSNDNCIFKVNKEQLDADGDLVGDACDFDNSSKNFFDKDSDNDGHGDSLDNCPYVYNPRQIDSNADKRGDLCSDDDHDGIIGRKDNCVNIPNRDQKDVNNNGIGDACEFDKDKDGIFDSIDNCINTVNASQLDDDNDNIGNACDNCDLYNPSQIDKNQNEIGDKCEEAEEYKIKNDKDEDGILDNKDNCDEVSNFDQLDDDKDNIGNVCDNCINLKNKNQLDKDENGIGDLCEDSDGDGYDGYLDNCIYLENKDQKDVDNDGVGDACEDDDRDGIVAASDNCPFKYNKDQIDVDNDGVGDACDEKDNRFLESNKEVFVFLIVLLTIIFAGLIFIMLKKIKSDNIINEDDLDKSSSDTEEINN